MLLPLQMKIIKLDFAIIEEMSRTVCDVIYVLLTSMQIIKAFSFVPAIHQSKKIPTDFPSCVTQHLSIDNTTLNVNFEQ